MATIIKSAKDITSVLAQSERSIGLVTTMGALHDGHISLIKASKFDCKTTVVSIYVNPLQFGPNEDYKTYPRDLKSDLKICEENNVDYVFVPDDNEIYPGDNKENIVKPPISLASDLCGKTRINHFSGVSTVVKRLFEIVQPDYSYFGEKDLQQLYVVKWLVKEFNLPIFVRACPTVRESSGLAFSSRNLNLSAKEKEIASNLHKALVMAKKNIRSGFFNLSKSILESLIFLSKFPEIKVEYFEARDKNDFSKVDDEKKEGFYLLIAAKVGKTRLIDNVEI